MNSKKASRSRGVRTWPVVVLRRRVLGGCACAGDRVLRGDGRGLVWLRVQVQVLGPLRGGEVGGGRCEGERRAGEEGTSSDSSCWGEQNGEPRDSRVRRWKEAAAAQNIPKCISAEEQERAACAAREKGVGVIVPGARVVWEGRRDESPQNISSEPSKYLLLCRSGTRIALSNEDVISMVCRSRFPSHVTRRRVLGGAEVDCRRRPFRDNPLDQKIKKTSET